MFLCPYASRSFPSSTLRELRHFRALFSPSACPGESITETIQKVIFCLALLGGAGGLLLRLLEDLLDDLLLLDQECTDDAVLDAVGAAGTTVGTRDVLLGTRDLSVLTGAEGRDLYENPVSDPP